MTITFVAAGSAVQTSTTTLALVAPTLLVDDILIAQIISINNGAITAPDATWTEIQQANFTGSRAALFWKRVITGDSGATFNFTVAGTTTSYGILTHYRGVRYHGPAIGTSTLSANASADNVTYATLTPHSNGGVVVACGFYAEDATTAGTVSGTNPTFNAPSVDVEQATLENASLFQSYGYSLGGATGAVTQSTTSTIDAVSAGVLFDLLPPIAGGGGSGVIYPPRERNGDRN